ncbi:MAG TPA: MFS transporter [Roseiflexaceae bacterium]|nr:MFS transporter [Roseiflexaceae bacterium]
MSTTRSCTSESTTRASSAWGPLARPVFRALWLAALASNIGTLMQGVAAAWLMTSLTSSPVPVALLTTVSNLPLLLVGLPAGAIADMVDRRWLVILTQVWMLAVAALLGGLTLIGWMTPTILLALSFLIGLGGALSAPAWQAIVPELVPRRELPTAIALNSAGFNLARATGPAVGGLIVAASGPATVFWLNAASFIGVMFVIYFWKPAAREQSALPERVGSAIAAGMRFTRHSPPLRAVLLRTIAWMFPASALLALLPVVATRQLGLDATGYGVLLASIGIGAVGGAVALPQLRARLSVDRLVVLLTLVFAGGLVGLALIHNFVALNIVLMTAGVGWLTVNSFLNVSAQVTTPAWVQARALGVYLLASQGALAGGSAVWGLIAERFDERIALLAAAALLVLGVVTALRWKLSAGEDLDLRPSQHWPEPELALDLDASDGPVLVTVEYRVALTNQAAFYEAMASVEINRRRDGAHRWRLFRDAADPERLLETFVVGSWAEHMRQHERVTVADRAIEQRALALQQPGIAPIISHFIAAPQIARKSRSQRRAR